MVVGTWFHIWHTPFDLSMLLSKWKGDTNNRKHEQGEGACNSENMEEEHKEEKRIPEPVNKKKSREEGTGREGMAQWSTDEWKDEREAETVEHPGGAKLKRPSKAERIEEGPKNAKHEQGKGMKE